MLSHKLVDEERQAMADFISEYAYYSVTRDRIADIDSILSFWNVAKKEYLYQMFGQKFILSKDLNYSMGLEELADAIDSELFWHGAPASRFVRAYRMLTSWDGPLQHNYEVDSLLDSYVLARNTYTGDNFNIPLPNGNVLQVNKGCKVSKILGKIAAAFELEGYEEFRIAHSQVLNQKSLKGKLCISIHPLDYMTMSANNCGWTSCMDWTDNGEYRRGTVEMMNSPMVIVAYLTAKDPYKVGELDWSNKKWRQLFVVNKDIITGVKAYPYYNENLEKAVCEWLRDLAKENLGWTYADQYVEYWHSQTTNVLDRPIRITFHTGVMYNDFGTVDHHGFISSEIPGEYHCTYSGVANCMCCGEDENDFDDSEHSLTCMECEHTMRCYDCGTLYDANDLLYLDGDYYCEYCYDHASCNCEICGETHHNNCCYDVYLARKMDDGNYYIMKDICITVCEDCFQKLKGENKYIKSRAGIHECEHYWSTYHFVLADDCTEEGLNLFSFDNMEELNEYVSCDMVQADLN